MFIRRTTTRSMDSGVRYFSYRLVHSVQTGQKIQQKTLLNLGRHFTVEKEHWPLLCKRVQDICKGVDVLLSDLPAPVEEKAQDIAAQLIVRQAEPIADQSSSTKTPDYRSVDIRSLESAQPRTIGVEHVGLWALRQVGLPKLLDELDIRPSLQRAALGSIIGRMAEPASERATYEWLTKSSGLGELIDTQFEAMSHMQLYRASDAAPCCDRAPCL